MMVYRESRAAASKNGVVIFYHGLGVCKEENEKELISFANAGMLAVGVDNYGHGERRYPDFDKRFGVYGTQNFEKELYIAIDRCADEISLIIDDLIANHGVCANKIGVCGISMGAHIAYAAAIRDRRIKAAAPILGTPSWKAFHDKSPALRAAEFFPCAILSQTGGADEVVPPEPARAFHAELKKYYSVIPEREMYIEFDGSGHTVPEQDWYMLWDNVISWFDKFLICG
jgi:dienelactone hydrolase